MRTDLQRALFLDRDGVVIEDCGFPHLPGHLVLCDGAIAGMRAAMTKGFTLVIVTNQSGIARGIFSLQQYFDFSDALLKRLSASGVAVAKSYFCPHLPDARVERWRRLCDCRKPLPGMLFLAARELSLDLSKSILVGDRISDVRAARAAGLSASYLINGHSKNQELIQESVELREDKHFRGFYSDLSSVVASL